MNNKEVLLSVIAASKDQGLTPVQLQKSLFVVGKCKLPELPSEYYEFVPYDYGPFNKEIYIDVKDLVQEGAIEASNLSGQSWLIYTATSKGKKQAGQLEKRTGIECRLSNYINEVVNWVLSLSFRDLLKAIYSQYPEYRTNSVFEE
ncbi:hypothetical protein ACFLYS_02640 [Chloroflexota bacterium]